MANTNKTYFLVSSWDFPKGSVCLGSLTSSPEQPHITLFKPGDGDIDTTTFPTTKDDYTGVVRSEKGDKGGLFFRFLDLFGLGAEASVKYDRKAVLKYSFKHMHTEWFIPSEDLVKKAVQSKRAASHLKRIAYDSPLYMITGLKIVEGASVTTLKNKGKDFTAFLGVDAGPVSVGPQASHNSQSTELQTFSNSTPIVFAFQLMEVRCDAKGNVSTMAYNTGALFGLDVDSGLPAEELEKTVAKEVTSEVLKKEFGDAFSASASIDEEDGSPCVVIVPVTATTA
ncbi:hypothetical protein M441DRAFT_429098 [Trichoderma asperellum CBS 433.97]|uniref:Uncharacterized protein n=1 Tax=Trichoderma asperellum (strain ATCC 204424 / CBS 433.97 / NBRC 101777) TaxID=1042311 RepID=A0A2T3Z5X8_TRIA4|nr:hypothetical protein M441DRAFT_429098 [Trichoderma asperellum CBS 433.97]PTB40213.1 hypothetical protein M441DRAFT_429098 [Trichoderma asperellum CBS 433.97]